ALCVMPAIAEELLFRGAFKGLMRPCGSAAAIFAPALLFGVLHLDLAQGLTAFACGVFLGWLAERSGSILPGMLLHLVNNALAFLTIYLRYYAPAEVSFGVELFILLFFPAFGAWMICNARRQGFSFSAGLRPGVDVLTVFTSPVYCATVLFLVAYAAIFVH
ncbi:MAG: CPBP family intramembrane metalloprotease, partial [Subdoligranulum sp.]|nr:CPBP family intramembrane metalloprotease [Subdoligranulum sp.]